MRITYLFVIFCENKGTFSAPLCPALSLGYVYLVTNAFCLAFLCVFFFFLGGNKLK